MNETARSDQELELFERSMNDYADSGYREELSAQITELIERWAARGDNEVLLRATELTEARIRPKEPSTWNGLNSTLDRLEAAMAQLSPAADTLACLHLLLTERRGAESYFPRNSRMYDMRYYAALMASSRSGTELLSMLERASHDRSMPIESLALVLYEAALRGKVSGEEPAVLRLHDKIKQTNHPLVWLPLGFTELEKELPLRWYNRGGGGGHAMPFGPKRRIGKSGRKTVEAEANGSMPTAGTYPAIHTAQELDRLQAATRNWCERSNGKSEGAIFDLRAACEPEYITADLLLSLGLTCLQGVAADHVLLRPLLPSEAFGIMYAAAANGGAYSNGNQNAYGRLEAWLSMGALTGSPEEADALSVLRAADSCAWLYFEAPTPWFRQVAWDFGIAALRPDGRTLAVLAATDTD
jgi:hypothetical protein